MALALDRAQVVFLPLFAYIARKVIGTEQNGGMTSFSVLKKRFLLWIILELQTVCVILGMSGNVL